MKALILVLATFISALGFAQPLNNQIIQVMDAKLSKIERTLKKDDGLRGPDFGFFTLSFDVGIGINTGGLFKATLTPYIDLSWYKDPSH